MSRGLVLLGSARRFEALRVLGFRVNGSETWRAQGVGILCVCRRDIVTMDGSSFASLVASPQS